MSGKIGEKITGERITIWDDGRDPRGIVLPFDFEGVPKQRVDLIEQGVARGAVYDSYRAGKEKGKASTGHALPAPRPCQLRVVHREIVLVGLEEEIQRLGRPRVYEQLTGPIEVVQGIAKGRRRQLAHAHAVPVEHATTALDLFDEVRAMTWRLLHPKPA